MKDYIKALKEIKKESKDFKITLSKKEVLELTNYIDNLHSIIEEVREYIKKEYKENNIIIDYCDNPITPQDLYSDILKILDKEKEQ